MAEEYGHWYDRHGNLILEVPYAASNKAKAGQLKNVTLREARPLGLKPSVTTVISERARPGLEQWRLDRALEVARENPHWSSKDIIEAANDYVAYAAQAGTKIHLGISEHLNGRTIEIEPEIDEIVRNFWPWYGNSGFQVKWSERPVVAKQGYAGTIDATGTYNLRPALGDFKTQDFEEERKALYYPEHALQLAGYDDALGPDPEGEREWISIILSRQVPGLVAMHIWPMETHDRWRSAWRSLWQHWQDMHNYYPGEMFDPDNTEGNGWH